MPVSPSLSASAILQWRLRHIACTPISVGDRAQCRALCRCRCIQNQPAGQPASRQQLRCLTTRRLAPKLHTRKGEQSTLCSAESLGAPRVRQASIYNMRTRAEQRILAGPIVVMAQSMEERAHTHLVRFRNVSRNTCLLMMTKSSSSSSS